MNYFTSAKPYNSLNEYYKREYGKKVAKISLNAGFTCPNRDGKKGYGGCIFCSKDLSGDFAGDKNKSLKEQFDDIKEVILKKWPDTLFIPYFQAGSNTYAPIEYLKKIFNEAILFDPKVVGISIATRGDCINHDIAKMLGDINKKIHVQVELGLQSANEKTSDYINRKMTNQEFEIAVELLRKENIEVVCHIINGLPNETIDNMLDTIRYINKLDIQGVKIHSLLILKDTILADNYKKDKFPILDLEKYVEIVCKQISILRPDIIIHRLAADGNANDLILPLWTKKKMVVMNEIDKYLRKNNIYQGKEYKK
ncbi:MAG: TIGR01212 family radical SAM protein [Acholeplasmatales bacterium]|nr:TIGR01212 family radical SAM protein [Acholeplasmatales bacterium]